MPLSRALGPSLFLLDPVPLIPSFCLSLAKGNLFLVLCSQLVKDPELASGWENCLNHVYALMYWINFIL